MAHNLKKSTLLFTALLTLASCSSIINGSKQDVSVISEPADATVTIDGHSGTGHLMLPLTRGKPHLIEVKKDGYQTVRITTGSGVAGWYYGNILLFDIGIPGEIIDLATGSAYSVNPDKTTVVLEKGIGVIEQTTGNTATFGIIGEIVLDLVITVAGLAIALAAAFGKL
jgi:hypothetical protein